MKNIMDYIIEYIDKCNVREPIFTKDIYLYIEKYINDVDKMVVNEYITRYEKKNPDFVRYKKGIYYKTVATAFGKASIKINELIKKLYLEEGEEVIGYESGPSLMNKLGLTTQMSKHIYIITMNNRTFKCNDEIILNKPVIDIDKNNYRYLQLLDILENKYKVNVETDNYFKILREYIDNYELNFEQLLYYSTFYKNNKIYGEIAKLATKGDNNEVAFG